jgi:hypothetical protein
MGRGIGAQEHPVMARGRQLAQRQAVLLALGHRQAIGMRAHAAHQHGVAVDVQVLRRDRGAQVGAAAFDELRGFLRGDVLEHDFQRGEIAHQRSACVR